MTAELLSPAGDAECLRAAALAGADAVYIGERNFSARKGAKNFTWDEIAEASAFCRERGVKLYLALNTLIRYGEEKSAAEAVALAAKNGVDALIIQDLGLMKIASEVCPSLPLHASTQLAAHTAGDVRTLMKLGFSRVVLSRELSRDEIAKIYAETGCEIEAFAHGALCVCFSGRCLMSSFIGGRSGNRGSCAQPCRKLYSAEGKNGFFLSPRDLCLVKRLEDMKKAGVVSFKIEGRMKSPEYVALVTSIYRRALDGEPLTEGDMADLRGIFSRGGEFTEGWFSGKNTPEMMNYALSNDNISASAPKELLIRARAIYRAGVERQSVALRAELTAREGEPLCLAVSDGEHTAAARGKPPEKAVGAALTAEKAEDRLKKTGGTPYFIRSFGADIAPGLFVPAAELNALRRSCFGALGKMRRALPEREVFPFSPQPEVKKEPREVSLIAEVTTREQLSAAVEADKVIVPLALLDSAELKKNYAASLPQIILDVASVRRRLGRLPKGTEVYSSTLGGLALIREAGLAPAGDFGLNVSNVSCARVLAGFAERLTLSPELNLREISAIAAASPVPLEVIAYGRQRVMVSRACIIRGVRGKCGCESPLVLRDKTGAEFTVLGDSETHLNTVLNSRPTFMADRLAELRRAGADIRLCFTTESAREARGVIRKYRRGGEAEGEFTRGYFFK